MNLVPQNPNVAAATFVTAETGIVYLGAKMLESLGIEAVNPNLTALITGVTVGVVVAGVRVGAIRKEKKKKSATLEQKRNQ